jgi:nucleoside-diphosphate-sugar epimerase
VDEKLFKVKRILLTGGSGFLGKYLLLACKNAGMSPVTIGRSKSNDVVCDLTITVPNIPEKEIEKVIFAAGKAHVVPKSEKEIREFFEVNVRGLENFLKGIEEIKIKQLVFISTVSVYGLWKGKNISEEDGLKSEEPYGKSKIEAERLVTKWGEKMGVSIVIFRIPLLAGSNPPGNLGEMISAILKNKYPRIGKGEARKSMVLAEDVAEFCLKLKGNETGIYNLTDGQHPSFFEIEDHLRKLLNKPQSIVIPKFFVKILAIIGDFLPKFPMDSHRFKKMTLDLTFSSEKATRELNWKPRKVIEVNFLKN